MSVATPSGSMVLPLAGLRVVDLTMNISGPYATMILGDLGATVTKIERSRLGDDTRRWGPVHADGSAYFYAVNRNKQSVIVDQPDDAGRHPPLILLADAMRSSPTSDWRSSSVSGDALAIHQTAIVLALAERRKRLDAPQSSVTAKDLVANMVGAPSSEDRSA